QNSEPALGSRKSAALGRSALPWLNGATNLRECPALQPLGSKLLVAHSISVFWCSDTSLAVGGVVEAHPAQARTARTARGNFIVADLISFVRYRSYAPDGRNFPALPRGPFARATLRGRLHCSPADRPGADRRVPRRVRGFP